MAGLMPWPLRDAVPRRVERSAHWSGFWINPSPEVELEIVSGTARGVDQLGERYALERGLKLKKFPANWDKYGRKAGYLRNKEMAEYARILIAFWDGKSKGTKHMIDLAQKYGVFIIIERIWMK